MTRKYSITNPAQKRNVFQVLAQYMLGFLDMTQHSAN